MTTKEFKAYAVKFDGIVHINTVSAYPRAAMVNWLHTHGVRVFHYHTDADIEDMWDRNHGNAELVEVTVREKECL